MYVYIDNSKKKWNTGKTDDKTDDFRLVFFLVGYQREKKLGFSYIFGSSIYICKIFLCVCAHVVYFKREKWFSFCFVFVFFCQACEEFSSLPHFSFIYRVLLHCITIHFTEFEWNSNGKEFHPIFIAILIWNWWNFQIYLLTFFSFSIFILFSWTRKKFIVIFIHNLKFAFVICNCNVLIAFICVLSETNKKKKFARQKKRKSQD